MHKKDSILIGKLGKTNGNEGYLLAHLAKNIPEFSNNISFIHIDMGPGELVPFPVEYISGTSSSVRIKFEFINSVEKASGIVGKDIYISISDITNIDDPVFSYNKIIGWSILNNDNVFVGHIKDVIERPGQDLLLVQRNEKDIYIPLHEDFIMNIDEEKEIMTMNLPEGLLEIND